MDAYFPIAHAAVGWYGPNPEYLFIKRALNLFLSGLALVLLSPIMVTVGIVIKAIDSGLAFYKPCRLTKDGKTFSVLKFRSMRVDAEKGGVARLSTGDDDDRINPDWKVHPKVLFE